MPGLPPQLINTAFASLRKTLNSYYPLSNCTWEAFRSICRCREIEKGVPLYSAGEVPTTFSYVYRGLFRIYVMDERGNEYNKNFFPEGRFPGAMAALLKGEPSRFTIDALEDSIIIEIDHQGYRQLLNTFDDLKRYHIQ
ncbi:cyclic nucleotide-binding domain-containing protein [Microbulbifer bruguierae]|uniref:Cyclic nucleotide-binding domain-containing protein n=1 Tax=Microbulbifer bruguierae TaxID=3029061 RepID=A0ABY8NB45_9GAMM|nr:cyclic nucleotide-binding domain-containing protein [Microbulbifer bruguierae]WGL15017.1 cyclic nucleotide-binding domain-containing protein [Microbulbifer bruguierae]